MYRKLMRLLENESEQISKCVQGELLTLYREVIDKEKNLIQKEVKEIHRKL